MFAPHSSAPLHERSRYRAAADCALRRYPGPIGELIHRELTSHAELGCGVSDPAALIPRLARAILRPAPRAAAAEPTTVRAARVAD
ncbi:hypothetical protein [Pseudonocardia pini]|uniref:hypothetical protein n=1 Tax=Pseudonocardia pini TaxID=2758030 RepID=UPI0015F02632|nr:hypothetical protein [Pseudonocardia pini]